MALLNSYPRISTASIDSNDLLVVSQDSPTGETLNMSVGQITDFIINSGAAGSAENQDYVESLKGNITFNGGIMSVKGYYNTSETANLLSSKADISLVNGLSSRVSTVENSIVATDTILNNHISLYNSYTSTTATTLGELNSLSASNSGNIAQLKIDQDVIMRRFDNYSATFVVNNMINSAVASRVEISTFNTLSASVAGNTASVSLNQSAIATETSARVQSINTLSASVGQANALIETNRVAVANETSARVSQGTTLQASIDGNSSSITTNQTAIANVDGTVDALYSLDVTANGNVAGMKLGANNDGSFVSFLADSFKIYNGSAQEAPFEVIGGAVKIKSASIGNVAFGNITGVPTTFQQCTTVYANDINGSGASTTRGTRNFVAWFNDINLWTPSEGVAGLEFQQIKGDAGPDGSSVTIKGTVASVNDLPSATSTIGDGYIIGTDLYVFEGGTTWVNVGTVQGPPGTNGTNGANGADGANGTNGIDGTNGVDGFDGNDGVYTSFVYLVNNTAPGTPQGGTFNGSTETYPTSSQGTWSDEPSASTEDTEWVSVTKYSNNKSDNSWTNSGWSTPSKIYQKGATGSTGAAGADGTNGTDGLNGLDGVNGASVRVEYSYDGITNWSVVQTGVERYIRTSTDTNGDGNYVPGPASKYIPELGVEYFNGLDGVSSYIHIKYSNDGVSFTGNNGEDVGEWIGQYSDSNQYDSTVFGDYKWKKIAGTNGAQGANGFKTKTGLVWYSANSASNPGEPSATGYNFTNNTITGLSSGWSLSPPVMQPGTASNLYWTSTYNVTEQASPANTGTISFEATTQAFGFDQVVTFNSLSTNSSTVINGENITTGIIQSSNYAAPGYNNLNFSTQGMGIDLNDGSIHAEQFYVNANGSAGFGGSINLTSPATTTRGVQTINLAPSAAEISVSHASTLVNGLFPSGTGASKLSSEGLYIDNAGNSVQNIETVTGGDGDRDGVTACQFEGKARLMVPTSTYPDGEVISGLFATAYNKADDGVNRDTSVRRAEAYGAVIENLRADGLAERLHNIPSSASSPYRLPDLYAHYIHFSSSATVLQLPSNPKTGQVVKVTRIGSATPTVVSTQTDFSSSGGTNKIRVQNSWDADITVSKTEEFIFQGFFWVRVNHD